MLSFLLVKKRREKRRREGTKNINPETKFQLLCDCHPKYVTRFLYDFSFLRRLFSFVYSYYSFGTPYFSIICITLVECLVSYLPQLTFHVSSKNLVMRFFFLSFFLFRRHTFSVYLYIYPSKHSSRVKKKRQTGMSEDWLYKRLVYFCKQSEKEERKY